MTTKPVQRVDTRQQTRIGSTLSLLAAVLAGWLYVKPRTGGLTTNLIGYGLKIMAGALAPLISVMGFLGALMARRHRRPLTSLLGGAGALLAARFVHRLSEPHDGFEQAFGPDHAPPVPPVHRRWPRKARRGGRRPQVIRDLVYARVPDAERPLLCDLWLPRTPRSGVAVIYLHGGSWQAFDKDVATRPFFRHLTDQGHVVMDVAYRLAHDTDMRGMLGDVKRAVAWMKRHAAYLGADPARVVLSGGSAGGHLALLTAYTPNHPDLDPPDVRNIDTTVRGVIAYYPVADLRTLADHWSEQSMHPLATALGKILGYFPPEGYLPWSRLVRRLFGAPLDDVGDALLTFSPVAHVGPHCPPTLLIQGLHDHVIPVQDVHILHQMVHEAGRPSVLVELPQVEHAFDMIALPISPPAQAALCDVERFLSLMR